MGKSNELIIGNGKGIWKTRSVQRKPIGERWDPKTLELVKHPPWRTSDDDPNVDGEVPDITRMIMTPRQKEEAKEEVIVPRRMYLKKEDFERHGYTRDCLGCKALLMGARAVGHSAACRMWMEKQLEGTERSERARDKEFKFYEQVLEREDRKRGRDQDREDKEEGGRKMAVEEPAAGQPAGSHASASGISEEERKRTFDGHRQEEAKVRRTEKDEAKRKRKHDDVSEDEETRQDPKAMVGELEVHQEVDCEGWTFDPNDDFESFADEKEGLDLDPKLVEAAEREELEYMEDLGVGEVVDEGECERMIGRSPVTTKWVRVNKGTSEKPMIRARLVARDFKVKGDDRGALFASMPPLEAKKMMFRMAARERRVWREGRWQRRKLFFVDVKKAHLYGKVPHDTYAYVRLPDGRVWRLRRWLYGMRPAARAWEDDFSSNLESVGFARGKSAPTVFYREATGCRCVVHGDDFTFMSFDSDGKKVVSDMEVWYNLKLRAVVGDDEGDDKEVTILNRTLKHVGDGLEYHADERHESAIRQMFGIGAGANGLESPVEKEELPEGFDEEKDDPELAPLDMKGYRAVAARGNYLSLDRMDLQFAAKEACRQMARPRVSGQVRMKRLARYLHTYPKLVWRFGREVHDESVIDVFSDSDWAACRRTRRSTSGGVASIDGAAVKHWSSTQGSVALSVGEAEYYALIKAAAEGLGLVSLAKDLGYDFQLRLHVDSTTAKAIVSRLGLGRVRHMEVRYLWAQEAYKRKKFEVVKVPGGKNPADVLTKPMTAGEMVEKLAVVGARFADVRKPWCKGRVKWADCGDDADG